MRICTYLSIIIIALIAMLAFGGCSGDHQSVIASESSASDDSGSLISRNASSEDVILPPVYGVAETLSKINVPTGLVKYVEEIIGLMEEGVGYEDIANGTLEQRRALIYYAFANYVSIYFDEVVLISKPCAEGASTLTAQQIAANYNATVDCSLYGVDHDLHYLTWSTGKSRQDLADTCDSILTLYSATFDFVEPETYSEVTDSPTDDYAKLIVGMSWPVLKLSAPVAWEKTEGQGVIVALIDSGVELTHPQLSGRLINLGSYGYKVNPTGQGSQYDPSPVGTLDEHEHGTKMAGVIASNRGDGLTVGIAPQALVAPFNVMFSNGRMKTKNIVRSVREIVRAKNDGFNIRVVNMSFSSSEYTLEKKDYIDLIVANDMIPVSGYHSNRDDYIRYNRESVFPVYPGSIAGCLGVESIDYNGKYDIDTWSIVTQEHWPVCNMFGQVAAPGSSMTTVRNGGIDDGSGVSFSIAITSGALALVFAANASNPSYTAVNARMDLIVNGNLKYDYIYSPRVVDLSFLNPGVMEFESNAANINSNACVAFGNHNLLILQSVNPMEVMPGDYTLTTKLLQNTNDDYQWSDISIPNHQEVGVPAIERLVSVDVGQNNVPHALLLSGATVIGTDVYRYLLQSILLYNSGNDTYYWTTPVNLGSVIDPDIIDYEVIPLDDSSYVLLSSDGSTGLMQLDGSLSFELSPSVPQYFEYCDLTSPVHNGDDSPDMVLLTRSWTNDTSMIFVRDNGLWSPYGVGDCNLYEWVVIGPMSESVAVATFSMEENNGIGDMVKFKRVVGSIYEDLFSKSIEEHYLKPSAAYTCKVYGSTQVVGIEEYDDFPIALMYTNDFIDGSHAITMQSIRKTTTDQISEMLDGCLEYSGTSLFNPYCFSLDGFERLHMVYYADNNINNLKYEVKTLSMMNGVNQ